MSTALTVEQINKLSHVEMASLWRFGSTPSLFQTGTPTCDAFMARWETFGGMTVSISKAIGW